MFHTTHIHVPRGTRRQSALRTFIASSSFGPPDSKDPVRRGILLTAVACVLLMIGSVLTWLGFNELLGGRMSMTGPLLIMLSFLLMLLSIRQFLLARKRNSSNRSSMQLNSVNGESVTAVVVNQDDGLHPATIIVDRYNRLTYDPTAALLRHRQSIDNDYAPPSYHEVTRQSGSSNAATHEGPDELPPTYEETMGSSIYSSHHVMSTSILERSSMGLSYSHAVALARTETRRGDGDRTPVRCLEDDWNEGNPPESIRGPPHYSRLRKPTPLPSLQLEVALRSQCEVSVSPVPVQTVVPPPQNNLSLPPLHLSAPTMPRQLSAPPSPHPFSAPPSPRQLSPHKLVATPLQYPGGSYSAQHMSPPSSPRVMPVPLTSTQAFHSLPPPHTFSAPSSPRPFSGQHSLTPPPQYTSTPPSPRPLSAPVSPLMFQPARSPCYGQPTSPMPMQLVSSQPSVHQFSAGTQGPADWLHFSALSQFYLFPNNTQQQMSLATQSWDAPQPGVPDVGSSQDGYTCFTYNFVTPHPFETSDSSLLGTPSALSYPASHLNPEPTRVGDGRSVRQAVAPLAGVPGRMGEGRAACMGSSTLPSQVLQSGVNGAHGDGEASVYMAAFTSRTDIQAKI